jgi:hypothetical protein
MHAGVCGGGGELGSSSTRTIRHPGGRRREPRLLAVQCRVGSHPACPPAPTGAMRAAAKAAPLPAAARRRRSALPAAHLEEGVPPAGRGERQRVVLQRYVLGEGAAAGRAAERVAAACPRCAAAAAAVILPLGVHDQLLQAQGGQGGKGPPRGHQGRVVVCTRQGRAGLLAVQLRSRQAGRRGATGRAARPAPFYSIPPHPIPPHLIPPSPCKTRTSQKCSYCFLLAASFCSQHAVSGGR